jgi:hypothetical protein
MHWQCRSRPYRHNHTGCINKDKNLIATESTEKHEKIYWKAFIFPCSSVDSVAIK